MGKTYDVDLELEGGETPQYIQDFVNQYNTELKSLTKEMIETWGKAPPKEVIGFMLKIGIDPSPYMCLNLMASIVPNPLMEHTVAVTLFACAGKKERTKELINKLTDYYLENINIDTIRRTFGETNDN